MRMLPRSQNASLLLIALLSVIPAVLWGLYAGFWYMDGLVLPGFLLGLGVWAANRFGARGDSGWSDASRCRKPCPGREPE